MPKAKKVKIAQTEKSEPAHHPTLAPSSFPALQICSHFQPGGESNVYTERGDRIHKLTAQMLQVGQGKGGVIPGLPKDEWDSASWMAQETSIILDGTIHGIEERIEVLDPLTGEVITFGRLDCWGYTKKPKDSIYKPKLIDWKSGQEDDYLAQVAIYALGLMDKLEADSIETWILFGDQKTRKRYMLTREACEQILSETLYRRTQPDEPYSTSKWCNRCAFRAKCPAWTKPAENSLAILSNEAQLEFKLTLTLDEVKADPEKLGPFIGGVKKLEKLIADAKLSAKAIEYIQKGIDVPGWKVVERSGRREYAIDSVKTLLYLIKDGTLEIDDIYTAFKIDPAELEKIFEGKPCPVDSIVRGTYKVLWPKK